MSLTVVDSSGQNVGGIAVWRPADHTWYVRGLATVSWGACGDIPEPGDYYGERRTDIESGDPPPVFGTSAAVSPVTWGVRGDVPLPGLVRR